MATVVEMLVAAATLQPLVLPAERVQRTIARFATKDETLPVVVGASGALVAA